MRWTYLRYLVSEVHGGLTQQYLCDSRQQFLFSRFQPRRRDSTAMTRVTRQDRWIPRTTNVRTFGLKSIQKLVGASEQRVDADRKMYWV